MQITGTHCQILYDSVPGTFLCQLFGDHYNGRRSTLIASQLLIEHWHYYSGETTLTDASLDRLLHGAHRLNLQVESM
ncbi:ATP-binding protein [endosymbiont of Ridgeia piscesae]|uniref:ATP-binding protein n=1 Tax=endosymbiont of Ridgeia piscesae TaxID=54398 RepID=UPI001E5264DF|nr:ATP-binding protein [endosymbiont of Ridgeia piscesae]